jgi:hypothetical protein
MDPGQGNGENRRTEIAARIAELSNLLGMIPSDTSIEVHAPLTDEIMGLSDWLSAARGSLLKLSLLISKELDLQLH